MSRWRGSGSWGCSRRKPTSKSWAQCADGVQAVNAIQQLSPELVFLDVQMPAVDGFGVIRQVGPRRCRWWSS